MTTNVQIQLQMCESLLFICQRELVVGCWVMKNNMNRITPHLVVVLRGIPYNVEGGAPPSPSLRRSLVL